MRYAMWAAILTAAGSSLAAESRVAGVWTGKMNNVPAVKLMVTESGGKIGGSATFYMIKDDGSGAKVDGESTAAIENAKLEGDVFTFEVKAGERMARMRVDLTRGGATLRNLDAGELPPVRLVRQR